MCRSRATRWSRPSNDIPVPFPPSPWRRSARVRHPDCTPPRSFVGRQQVVPRNIEQPSAASSFVPPLASEAPIPKGVRFALIRDILIRQTPLGAKKMGSPDSLPITGLLLRWGAGEEECLNELVPLVDRKSTRIAHHLMRK